MRTARRATLITLQCFALLVLAACSTLRGLPTHGGGKRMDEEQRALASAVRCAIADMELEELRGKTVQITVDGLAHKGGGRLTLPGITVLSAQLESDAARGATDYAPPIPGVRQKNVDSDATKSKHAGSGKTALRPNPTYNTSSFSTDADLNYLVAALNLKARQGGIKLVKRSPQVQLYVLVDVLGTNLSRQDGLIYSRDALQATCHLTYYAVHARKHALLFSARQTGARGLYTERGLPLFEASAVQRTSVCLPPLNLPVDRALVPRPLHAGETTAAADLKLPLREYQRRRLVAAKLALQQGDLETATQELAAARAVGPTDARLVELEERVAAARAAQVPRRFGWLI